MSKSWSELILSLLAIVAVLFLLFRGFEWVVTEDLDAITVGLQERGYELVEFKANLFACPDGTIVGGLVDAQDAKGGLHHGTVCIPADVRGALFNIS